ncbi:unnamed protein product [Cylicocyclus nassatus]|uniref:Uncharacterized protein n=1 Tax=Cylicocyclus nassatus TaxID=53992 RepID=A0AA36DNQ7_CYLNA|nr:unnamed protein product [Cylicocyclus nassatus]
MKYCWLAEVAKIVQKYQGRLSGVEAFNYRVKNRGNAKPDMGQLLEGFRTQFEGKISAFVPMVINEFAVLPFGCSFTNGKVMEIDCLFLTENFFEFLVQLAQIGGKEVKPPSLIFLAPYLQRLLAE